MIILEVRIWIYIKHNLGYANNRSAFDPFRSGLVYFNPLLSILVQFSLLQPISVQLGQFDLLWSIQSYSVYSVHSVQFGPFSLLCLIRSCSVHSVYFNPTWPIRSIQSTQSIRSNLVHLGLFSRIWSILSN